MAPSPNFLYPYTSLRFMKAPAPTLAPMLRSDTQGRLLARVLVDPAEEHNLTELVAWTESSMPTVQREVGRAEQAGIVLTRKVGPRGSFVRTSSIRCSPRSADSFSPPTVRPR